MKHLVPAVIEKPIRVAVLGSGAREHALAWKIVQSPHCHDVVVVPGNAGIALSGITCAAVESNDLESFIKTLKKLKTEFVVIGPDDLLSEGFADGLEAEGFAVFGPSKKASRLEWSKSFAKLMMDKASVPTARSVEWRSHEDALRGLTPTAVEFGGYPMVLKYDGLALGKGVRIVQSEEEAKEFLADVFEKQVFRRGGQNQPVVLCEEFLVGHEVSVFALCDGKTALVLEPACDHKRLKNGNRGPNTGGMGAFSPVPWLSPELMNAFKEKIFQPMLTVMREGKTPFKGLLYAGLMVKGDRFNVLEFNARFGDPETQALLPRMEFDLLPLLWACSQGELERVRDMMSLNWTPQACVNVVAASEGYPEAPKTGRGIQGVSSESLTRDSQSHAARDGVTVFFAGVKSVQENQLETSGGRVLGVTALGDSLELARMKAYERMESIFFEGMQKREDIGLLNG